MTDTPHPPTRRTGRPTGSDPVSVDPGREATRVLMADVLDAARDASPRRGDAAGLAAQIAALLADTDPVHPAAREVLAELLAGVCRHCGDEVREVRRRGRLDHWVHAGPESHGWRYCPWDAVRGDLRDRILGLGDHLRCFAPEVGHAARVGDPGHLALRARLVLARTVQLCLSESLVARPFRT